MTREEANKNIKIWIDEAVEGKLNKYRVWHYGKLELHRDIGRIYDDIDSRVCENCRHYSVGWCNILSFDISCNTKDFGCNKFEN